MATILTQQVNPWGAVAANLAGTLIGNMIQRSQEANQNRKLNALFNEVQNAVNAPQAQAFAAQSQVMPEDYNVDPWAKAFHQNYTPMTQYNIATADINPLVEAQKQASVQDYRNEVARQLASKRFGMLNPAMVEQYMTPIYQGLEKQQNEALKKEYADKLMNAQNPSERMNAAYGGAGMGVVPWDVVNQAMREYQYGNMSAADQANNEFRNQQFNEGVRQYNTNRSDANYWNGKEFGLKERQIANQEEAARYARENPGYTNIITGDDGGQWMVSPFGETKKINTGAIDDSTRLTPIEQAKIQTYQSQLTELNKQYQEYMKMKTDIVKGNIGGVTANTEFIDNELNRIEIERQQIADEVNKIYESKTIKNSDVNPTAQKTYDTAYRKNSNMSGWKYGNIIDKIASQHDVDPALIQAVIRVESNENPKAVSKKGAQGLMQLMPDTAKGLGVTDSFDPEQNINGGVKYLSKLLKKYGGDVKKALWGYNAGPGNADKGYMPEETKKYIQKVLAEYDETKKGNSNNNKLTAEDYSGLLEKVKAGKFPNIHNEAELQAELKRLGRSFDVGIKSEDVTPFKDENKGQNQPLPPDNAKYGGLRYEILKNRRN